MTEFKPIKEGKVREIYDNGDSLIMVATDRISAFDYILKNKITNKGKVLTQMSKFWFDYTRDVVPNHLISVDNKDMPEYFQQPEFEGKCTMCRKLTMLPIECIVRGYITGSGWASYQENGTACGIKLPEGLKESQKLPEPIYTPSTKAELGDHDENITFEQSITVLEKLFPGRPSGNRSDRPVSSSSVGNKSYALTISQHTLPGAIWQGQDIRNGTLTAESYIFIGKVPFPFPQIPCCPMLMPLSAEKITMVSSVKCFSSRASKSLPTCSSMALTAAK